MRGFIEFAQFVAAALLTAGSAAMVINAIMTEAPSRAMNVIFFLVITALFAAMTKKLFHEYQTTVKR